LDAYNPLVNDVTVNGREACSGTKYKINEESWWSAELTDGPW